MTMRSKQNVQPTRFRCAVYTRKSTEDGLEQEFNSLDAQREAGEAYIKSQAGAGWECLPDLYDDGGFTGGNMDRPGLRRLLVDIEAGKVDCVVVYKVDRLSRSLLDFARLMEAFDRHKVSFVSVTQQFNTASSMGRLILNVLLSFAQFEREMISERTRDKIAATRRKGKWAGGMPLLGYDVVNSKLIVVPEEAEQVRKIFQLYAEGEGLVWLASELGRRGWHNKRWTTRKGTTRGGRAFDKASVYCLLTNPAYLGKVRYKDEIHPGEHEAIVSEEAWHAVQQKLQFQRRTGGAMLRNKYGAILKGLLRCAPCGCAMAHSYASRGNKRYRYYVCTAAQKRGWDICPSKSIPAGTVEQYVVEQISGIGRDTQLIAETVHQMQEQSKKRLQELAAEERRLQRESQDCHAKMSTLVTGSLTGQASSEAIRELATLQERLTAIETLWKDYKAEADNLRNGLIDENQVAEALAEFETVWTNLNFNEQGRLLRTILERIDYDGRESTLSLTFNAVGLHSFGNRSAEVVS